MIKGGGDVNDKAAYACPRCQIGHLHQGKATFSVLYHGLLLTIQDMDAWTCDICQYREFDYDALSQVELLTGPLGSETELLRATNRSLGSDMSDLNKTQRLKP